MMGYPGVKFLRDGLVTNDIYRGMTIYKSHRLYKLRLIFTNPTHTHYPVLIHLCSVMTIDKRIVKIRLDCMIGMICCLFCIGLCSGYSICNKNIWQRVRYYLELVLIKIF